jgi:hypothetical protein
MQQLRSIVNQIGQIGEWPLTSSESRGCTDRFWPSGQWSGAQSTTEMDANPVRLKQADRCVPLASGSGVLRRGYGPCRDRTYDQLIKSQLLYQLS